MIRAIIFDLDDTLISEKQYIKSGFRHIARVLNEKMLIDENKVFEHLIQLFEESPKHVFNRLLNKYGLTFAEEDILQLIKEYRNHLPTIDFYDDVLPCLELLKKQGLMLGIITDGYAEAQRQKIKAIKANDYVKEIVVTDELGREYWKPHPKSFEIIKNRLNVEYSEMLYVGDNPEKDFYISSLLPIRTIRIVREDSTYKNAQYFKAKRETYNVNSLLELKFVLEKED
ncbi:HAD family hydrolase [Paenibacillus sp. BC26]|uniref:HAD family hydrolase n=1 Tax=Paenibacillus sp. BC26 TaxID=1881032 RepID=UPI0008ECC0E6|nr:HAD-IA family hydrolase [Paenibacillus sp. BC26]SFT25324.1 putative hydrolase of the HAD superfamily [Paenibacillus sp. BC26]